MEDKLNIVVQNLIKIMNDKKLNKVSFANLIGFPEAKWNKIANGKQRLSVNELSIIAEKLQVQEIDIFTYPKKFRETDSRNEDIDAQLTIKLKENLKQKVLEMIFGNKNMELLYR